MAIPINQHRGQAREVVDRETPIVFTNFTDEIFYGRWDKRIYELKAGKSYEIPFYLAEHFGRHLVTRELGNMVVKELNEAKKKNPNINREELTRIEEGIIGNVNLRQEFMDKCVERQSLSEIPGETSVIRPKEIDSKIRPPLKAEERAASLIEKGVPRDEFIHVTPRKADEDSFEGK